MLSFYTKACEGLIHKENTVGWVIFTLLVFRGATLPYVYPHYPLMVPSLFLLRAYDSCIYLLVYQVSCQ